MVLDYNAISIFDSTNFFELSQYTVKLSKLKIDFFCHIVIIFEKINYNCYHENGVKFL